MRPNSRAVFGFGLVLALVLSIVCASACESCGCGAPEAFVIATLTAMDGDGVERDVAAGVGQWRGVQVGARFSIGDGLKTTAPSQATVDFTGGGQLRVKPDTIIRFLVDGSQVGESVIDVQTGEALLMSGMAELRLRTHVGLAVIAPGTRIVLGREGAALNYAVELGEARFRSASGDETVLRAGESMDIEIGMAALRRKGVAEGPVADAGGIQAEIGEAVIAKIESAGVMVRAADARAQSPWQPLPKGERSLPSGTQLKLPAGTTIELSRGKDKARLSGAGEFVVGDGVVLVEAKQGGVYVDANAADVEILVPGGVIVARAGDGGSRGQVQVGPTSGMISVERGSIAYKDAAGSLELTSGEQHKFAIQALAQGGDSAPFTPGPDYSNLRVRAGESFVVHAPEVPVAIAFDASHKCKGEVALELGTVVASAKKQRGQGQGSANLLFPAGTRGYTARCVDERGGLGPIVARGSVQVLNDAGTRKLPPRPPTSEVETDGRTYSVYYQNQLPDIRVRWPNAPADQKYTLEIDGKAQPLAKPEHVFRSGSLRDGAHQLAFAAGSRRSRTTTVEVRFDNTAPTASLSAPTDRSFSPGASVSIEGVVLPAWKVSVDGGTITMEGAERFVGQVTTSAAKPDVAVRLTHPRLGTHYYLRRGVGSR
jgi:hypothetical protein